jgi:hypothetical protein
MTPIPRLAAAALLSIASLTDGAVVTRADTVTALLGACYCRVGQTLQCTSNLSEPDCRQRCNDALCDDWFWKERLPCWNWGYGG